MNSHSDKADANGPAEPPGPAVKLGPHLCPHPGGNLVCRLLGPEITVTDCRPHPDRAGDRAVNRWGLVTGMVRGSCRAAEVELRGSGHPARVDPVIRAKGVACHQHAITAELRSPVTGVPSV